MSDPFASLGVPKITGDVRVAAVSWIDHHTGISWKIHAEGRCLSAIVGIPLDPEFTVSEVARP